LVRCENQRREAAASKIQEWWIRVCQGKTERVKFEETRNKIIIIQSVIRCWIVRRRFCNIKKSVVCIQSYSRTLKCRRDFEHTRDHVVFIQRHWRSRIISRELRVSFLAKKNASQKIQSWWRMISATRKYEEMRSHTVKIQSYYRGYRERVMYLKSKEASIAIQRFWRSFSNVRRDRNNFLQMKYAVTVIETAWKCLQVKRSYIEKRNAALKIQGWWRGLMIQRKLIEIDVASRKIQKWWIANMKGRKTREMLKLKTESVIKLQAAFRAWKVRNAQAIENQAAIRIQSWLRMVRLRKTYCKLREGVIMMQVQVRANQQRDIAVHKFQMLRNSTIKIQSMWREKLVRDQIRLKSKAARTIQAFWRMYIQREKYSILRESATCIQIAYRSLRLGRKVRESFLVKKKASIEIQTWWRMVQCQQSFKAVVNIVIMLQAQFRRCLAMKRFVKLKSAALYVQRQYRRKLELVKFKQQMLIMQEEKLRKRRAAVRIQSFWRMQKDKRKYNFKLRSIVLLQSSVRGVLLRRNYLELKKAAVTIQSWWKSTVKDRQYEQLMKKVAATRIQSFWRMHREMRKYNLKLNGIILLQSSVRGILARKNYSREKNATVSIQRWWKCIRLYRYHKQMILQRKEASIKIQSWWRMLMEKKSLSEKLKAITVIQSFVRGFLGRKKYCSVKNATIAIQNQWRAYKLQKEVRGIYIEKKRAVLKVQSWWRMVRGRRKLLELKKYALLCQSMIRRNQRRGEYVRNREAAIVIQNWWRNGALSRVAKLEYKDKIVSAIKIQSYVRACIQRRKFQQILKACIMLQSFTRSYLAKKTLNKKLLEEKIDRSARIIQGHYRAMINRRKIKELIYRSKCNKAATIVQATVRGWLERKSLSKLNENALRIQTWWRSILLRKLNTKLVIETRSALLLQSWWRGIIIRRYFLRQRKAVVKLQTWTRAIIASRNFRQIKEAVCIIQNRWHARNQALSDRKTFLIIRSGTIKLQSQFRGDNSRRKHTRRLDSIIIIQKWTRGWLDRRFVTKKRMALLCIQQSLRKYNLARKYRLEFLRRRDVIIKLQAHCRGVLSRKGLLLMKERIKNEENLLKVQKKRLEIVEQHAAMKITSVIRTSIVRKKYLRIRNAITTIQKYWRGYWHRKYVMEDWKKYESKLCRISSINLRLKELKSDMKPEDSLGARTASAIDYIFGIKDMAELIDSVKTLDMATRLSLDCCLQMTIDQNGLTPVAQLMSLITRCNRSVPLMEVVSTCLDILINVARVDLIRSGVVHIPNLLGDIFQTMLVYRDLGADIFTKCCALLQVLSRCTEVASLLAEGANTNKLKSFETVVETKRKLKDENSRRRSLNVNTLPVPTSRKPLRPANSVNHLNRTSSNLALSRASSNLALNQSINIARKMNSSILPSSQKPKRRKSNTDVATGPPWYEYPQPRFHEDPLVAIKALNKALGILK